MEKEMKKVPAIRFKGFTGDWEQRKLGELGEIMTGSTPSTSNSEYYSEDGIPWVTPTDINSQTISDTPRKLSEEGMKVGRVVPANTILCTCIASIGKNTLLTVKGSFNQQINCLTPNEYNDAYFLLTESVFWSNIMKRMAAAGTMQIVNKTEFSELTTTVPKLEEQKKIGQYFRALDHLITLHQRKSDQLKKLKAYFLQNLFPAKGEKVPKIRFKGFTGEWEERKLGDICKVSSGIMGDSKLNNGTYHLTKIETISDGFVDENRVGYLNQKPDESFRLQKGDILYSNINSISHIGKVAKYEGHSLLYHGINLLRLTPSEETDSDFLLYFLNTKGKKNWARSHANPAVNQASINKTLLETQEIMVCDMEEQKKIGAFFSIIKNHLILHQQKITQLQAVKKFLLQNLFV